MTVYLLYVIMLVASQHLATRASDIILDDPIEQPIQSDDNMADILLGQSGEVNENHYLIKVKSDADENSLQEFLRKFGAPDGPIPDATILHCSSGPLSRNAELCPGVVRLEDLTLIVAKIESQSSLDYIRSQTHLIEYLEEDQTVSLAAERCTTQSGPTWGIDHVDPGDKYRDSVFKHDGNGGENIYAYILDTGIHLTHTHFQGRAIWGATFCSSTSCTHGADIHSHGTHVAGTVGANVYGVARGVNLVAVKVLDDNGGGTFSDAISGVNWAVANAKARNKRAVINMSLGGSKSTSLNAAVDAGSREGVVTVASAGNLYNTRSCDRSPAGAATAITAAAHDSSNRRASFSSYGTCVNVFAPGVAITSLKNANTGIAIKSGTSMAAPHVAGAVAQYLSRNPSASVSAVANWVSATAATGVITDPGTGSPNRMLQIPYCDSSAVTTPAPTPKPTTPKPTTPKPTTPAPTPEPSTPGPPAGCLHVESEVRMRDGSSRTLAQINPGDSVLTYDTHRGEMRYQPVLALIHHQETLGPVEMTEIRVAGDSAVQGVARMTNDHLVYVAENCHLDGNSDADEMKMSPICNYNINTKHAAEVKTDDYIFVNDYDNNKMLIRQVLNVTRMPLVGISNPITRTGTIIANNMLVSCYSTVNYPRFYHTLVIIYNMLLSTFNINNSDMQTIYPDYFVDLMEKYIS